MTHGGSIPASAFNMQKEREPDNPYPKGGGDRCITSKLLVVAAQLTGSLKYVGYCAFFGIN